MSTMAGGSAEPGATAVITHRVRDGAHDEYDAWQNEIAPVCRAAPGFLDLHIVRPVPGLTGTYTIIIRFETTADLRKWMNSPARENLIGKVRPLLVTGDDFFIRSGLDYWFAPEGARAGVPVRWKQTLVTWSAIFPLVLGVPPLVALVMRSLGAPDSHVLTTLAATGTICFLMVYVVMPRYTRLIQRWLFA